MAMTPEQRYQRKLTEKAVIGHPKEDILYAIFNEFAILHQQGHCFVIYPQMNLGHTRQTFGSSRLWFGKFHPPK